jgi:hypothetical protein
MKYLYLVLLLVTWSVLAAGETGVNPGIGKLPAAQTQSCDGVAQTGAAADRLAQQPECCKGNKGVCGCRAGKIVCCDKTFSDTCTCNRDEGPGAS